MRAQKLEHLRGGWADARREVRRNGATVSREPIGLFANEERQRRNTGRNYAASRRKFAIRLAQHGGMRRKPPPADASSQAQSVKDLRVVAHNSPRQNFPLPSVRRGFEPLELAEGFEHTAFTAQLGSRREVLPAQEPAHKLGGRDRLDFLAQHPQRQPVDAREQTAIAPLRTAPRELAAQDRPYGFQEIGRAPSELQSRENLVCRLLLEKKNKHTTLQHPI